MTFILEHNAKSYRIRVTQYGKYCEVREYAEMQFILYGRKRGHKPKIDKPYKRTPSSRWRAKSTIQQIIKANIGQHGNARPTFMTLTFKEDVVDLKVANREFHNFVKRLNRFTNLHTEYIAVHELQQLTRPDVIHYHVLFFNIPYGYDVRDVEKVWGHGQVHWRALQRIKNVALYITKYMTKAGDTHVKSFQKKYFTSRGVIKPVTSHEHTLDYLTERNTLSLIEQEAYESRRGGVVKSTYELHPLLP